MTNITLMFPAIKRRWIGYHIVSTGFLIFICGYSISEGQTVDALKKKEFDDGAVKLKSLLSEVQSIQFNCNVDAQTTEEGLRAANELASEAHMSQSYAYYGDSSGKFIEDITYGEPYSLKGQGSKSTFNGKVSERLMKGDKPLILLKEGKLNDNVLVASINPVLESIRFLTPNDDSDESPTRVPQFEELFKPATLERRLIQLKPETLSMDHGNVVFQMPGSGMRDGRRFNYEISLTNQKQLPIRITRRAVVDNQIITDFEVIRWTDVTVGNKIFSFPMQATEKVFSDKGVLLFTVSCSVSNLIVNTPLTAEQCTVSLAEADHLYDEDKRITIPLRRFNK